MAEDELVWIAGCKPLLARRLLNAGCRTRIVLSNPERRQIITYGGGVLAHKRLFSDLSGETLAFDIQSMADVARDAHGVGCSTWRRRHRRLRAFWRHEQQAVRMAVAAATHHSYDKSIVHACTQTDDEVLAATYAATAALAPVVEYVAPASAVTLDEPSPVVGCVAPTHVVTDATPAPTIEDVAPAPARARWKRHLEAPVIEYVGGAYATPIPVIEHVMPAPVVIYAAPSPVVEYVAPAPSAVLFSTYSSDRIRGTSTFCHLCCTSASTWHLHLLTPVEHIL